MKKTIIPAGFGTVLLIAAAIGATPMTSAEEVEVGPMKIVLTRLEPRIPVTVNDAPMVMTPFQKLGQIAAITVTIEDAQGADNTTFTTAGFGFTDACQIMITVPLVRECKIVPGTVQTVHAHDPDIVSDPLEKCIYGQRLSVSIGPFQPFFSTGELLTVAHGPCTA